MGLLSGLNITCCENFSLSLPDSWSSRCCCDKTSDEGVRHQDPLTNTVTTQPSLQHPIFSTGSPRGSRAGSPVDERVTELEIQLKVLQMSLQLEELKKKVKRQQRQIRDLSDPEDRSSSSSNSPISLPRVKKRKGGSEDFDRTKLENSLKQTPIREFSEEEIDQTVRRVMAQIAARDTKKEIEVDEITQLVIEELAKQNKTIERPRLAKFVDATFLQRVQKTSLSHLDAATQRVAQQAFNRAQETSTLV